jgi:hypothetical protein
MSNELYAFALKNTITEIKNACPEVSNTFIFRDDGTILAKDDETDAETATRAADALNALSKRAGTIGGFESATFHSTSNSMNVLRINEYYLAMIGSEERSGKNSTDLARILIPTVLRLTEKICNSFQEENSRIEKPEFSENTTPDIEETGTDLQAEEITVIEAEPVEEHSEPEPEPESLLPEPPVTQFMVENIGRLLAASDTVRIDTAVIQQWKDLYGEREINEVDVETLTGQTARCKFKPIKDSKLDGKGIIQLPQRIQLRLQTSKGELVMVKPAIGQPEA